VAIAASLRFFALQESIQPTPDFFNPPLKPAQQANRSRQNLPALHWKLARTYQISCSGNRIVILKIAAKYCTALLSLLLFVAKYCLVPFRLCRMK